jgi:ribosomal protein S18 acetylase RimI-like enzyme
MIDILVDIVPAAPEDKGFIEALSGEVFSIYGPYDKILIDYFNDRFTQVRIIKAKPNTEDDFKSIGFVIFFFFADDKNADSNPMDYEDEEFIADLTAIAIDPKWQSKGLGKWALKSIIAEINHIFGVDRIQLSVADTNHLGQKLFGDSGFNVIDDRNGFYPNGQRAIRMEWRAIKTNA